LFTFAAILSAAATHRYGGPVVVPAALALCGLTLLGPSIIVFIKYLVRVYKDAINETET
jgi:hypothetical protein